MRLVIVGDGPERAALESLAKEIYPSAEFVGTKHGGELKPYFEEADLFVLPGTGGLAVQEAMSYGLPIVVAQGYGTQDDLVRKGNGWQIPPDDFDALVSTMEDALSDIVRLRKMGEESYRIVKEEINTGKMVETFVTALTALTGKCIGCFLKVVIDQDVLQKARDIKDIVDLRIRADDFQVSGFIRLITMLMHQTQIALRRI